MQTLHESNHNAMEQYKTMQITAIKQATAAKQQHSGGQEIPVPESHFDVIEFIGQPRIDATLLLALIR
jgi:hypothetical protein